MNDNDKGTGMRGAKLQDNEHGAINQRKWLWDKFKTTKQRRISKGMFQEKQKLNKDSFERT